MFVRFPSGESTETFALSQLGTDVHETVLGHLLNVCKRDARKTYNC